MDVLNLLGKPWHGAVQDSEEGEDDGVSSCDVDHSAFCSCMQYAFFDWNKSRKLQRKKLFCFEQKSIGLTGSIDK